MKLQLDNLNLNYQRIEAIYGKDVDRNNKEITNLCKYFCTNGMIGCALSHRKCWKHIVDNKYKYAIILEDDTIINPDIINLKEDDINSDILLLGTTIGCYDKKVKPFIFTGTFGYLITFEGAKKALINQLVSYHVYFALALNNKMNIKCHNKTLITTIAKANDSSIIENNYNKTILDDIMIFNKISIQWLLEEPLLKIGFVRIDLYRIIILVSIIIIYYGWKKNRYLL
jgi:GR25 family glycosyltransferase involved in LPS biosynthesis